MDNQTNQYDNGGGYGSGGNGYGHGNNGGNGNGNGNQPPRRPNIMMVMMAILSTVLLIFMLWTLMNGSSGNTEEVSYTKFLEYINGDKVEAVEVQSTGRIDFILKEEEENKQTPSFQIGYPFYNNVRTTYSTIMMEDYDTLTARLEEHNVDGKRVLSDNSGRILDILLYVILPVVLMWVLLGVVFKKMGGAGGPMGVGKSNAKVYDINHCATR